MAKKQQIKSGDDFSFSVYESEPSSEKKNGGAVIILQEIFGVNAHIRSVADTFAQQGYVSIAPSLFDRVQRDVELDYTAEDREIGRGLAGRLAVEAVLLDIAATITHARKKVSDGKVGVVGYCLGGSYAWLAATRLEADAVVSYYGSKVVQHAEETPRSPVILHFGSQDKGIPLEDINRIKSRRPDLPVYLYEAGHAFNRQGNESYVAEAAQLALSRTLALFREKLLS